MELAGRSVIYAAETFANAMLEVLAHSNLSLVPKHHAFIRIEIPDAIKIEDILPSQLKDWPHTPEPVCRSLGDAWLSAGSTAVLRVHSVVTSGHERNLVINPAHPAFGKMKVTEPAPVVLESRLFAAKR